MSPSQPRPTEAPEAPLVAVRAESPALEATARDLGARLGLPVLAAGTADQRDDAAGPGQPPELILMVTAQRLELRAADPTRRRAVAVDWSLAASLQKPGAARALPLVRAVGSPRAGAAILDATAGLGRDAFRLAALGAHVLAAERAPILAALLADGLRRAREDPVTAELIGDRLSVHGVDARELLAQSPAPDVVLIDPMYPDAGRSALPRGEMQILRRLLGPDDDADALLAAARAVARRRVVVKRHVRDPVLPGPPPSHRVVGRSTRFDVYLTGAVPTDA